MDERKSSTNGHGAPEDLTDQQLCVEDLLESLRNYPEVWLPDSEDHPSWIAAAREASADAERMGVDLVSLALRAEKQILEEAEWLASRRASRIGLGQYLRRCRESRGLSHQELAANIAVFSAQEIARVEGAADPIYPLLEQRERGLVTWLTAVKANSQRVVRLLGNCSWPVGWQDHPAEAAMTYQPASADSEMASTEPPSRARAVINRLLAALDED